MPDDPLRDEAFAHLPTVVAEALRRLAEQDRDAASYAVEAWSDLAADGGPEAVGQRHLQEFLWYRLPRAFLADDEEHVAIAEALGRLLEELDLPRLAAICRSEETRDILQAWHREAREGFAAFEAAADRSGVEPPDTDDLAWGSMMTLEEAQARDHVGQRLEEAIVEERLRPGRSGWRRKQRALTETALDESLPGHPTGETWRQALTTARVQAWIDRSGAASASRRRLIDPLEPQLLHPVEVPDGAAEVTEPLRWLLARARDEGLPLTERGNLGRALVQEAQRRFGFEDWWFKDRLPSSELDVMTLMRWHELLRAQRWVRRRGRTLHATKAGEALADDVEAAWRALAAALAADDGFVGFIEEAAFLVLASEPRRGAKAFMEELVALAAEAGWRDRDHGGPPDVDAVSRTAWPLLGRLEDFGLLEPHRAGPVERLLVLTPPGQATAVEALRARAVAATDDPR